MSNNLAMQQISHDLLPLAFNIVVVNDIVMYNNTNYECVILFKAAQLFGIYWFPYDKLLNESFFFAEFKAIIPSSVQRRENLIQWNTECKICGPQPMFKSQVGHIGFLSKFDNLSEFEDGN